MKGQFFEHKFTPKHESFNVTFEFDNSLGAFTGILDLFKHRVENLPLHEYFLAPEYIINDDGTATVTVYSLVHRSHLPTREIMENRERDLKK